MKMEKKISRYLDEAFTPSLQKILSTTERGASYILVDKDGNKLYAVQEPIKTIKTARKAWEWKIKEDGYDTNGVYVVHLKKSTNNKLAVSFMPEQEKNPNFDYKEI